MRKAYDYEISVKVPDHRLSNAFWESLIWLFWETKVLHHPVVGDTAAGHHVALVSELDIFLLESSRVTHQKTAKIRAVISMNGTVASWSSVGWGIMAALIGLV